MKKVYVPTIQYNKEIPSEIIDILNLDIDQTHKESLKFVISKIFVSEIPIKMLTELNKTPDKYRLLVEIAKITEANLASIHRHAKALQRCGLIDVKEKVEGKKKKKFVKALFDLEPQSSSFKSKFSRMLDILPSKFHERLMLYLRKRNEGVDIVRDKGLEKVSPSLLTPLGFSHLTDANFTDNYEIVIKLSKKGEKEIEKIIQRIKKSEENDDKW